MQPITVIVVDKPFVAERVAPHALKRWPGHRMLYVDLSAAGGLLKPVYPDVKLSDLPAYFEPAWALNDTENAVLEWDGASLQPSDVPVARAMGDARELALIGVMNHTIAERMQKLVKVTSLGDEERKFAIFPLTDLGKGWERKVFSSGIDSNHKAYQHQLGAGKVKRWFEFNFAIYSKLVYGKCLMAAGHDDPDYVISKYGLALLFAIDRHGPLDERTLTSMLNNWEGRGKHWPCRLGTPSSQAQNVQNLFSAGLITVDSFRIVVTFKGRRFLSLLHHKSNDLDLPGRLEQSWMAEGMSCRRNMVKYFRGNFQAQLRFMEEPGWLDKLSEPAYRVA
ncbi:hypothetical protein ACYPKM_03915 [Pseudomonas aeruginosa]